MSRFICDKKEVRFAFSENCVTVISIGLQCNFFVRSKNFIEFYFTKNGEFKVFYFHFYLYEYFQCTF